MNEIVLKIEKLEELYDCLVKEVWSATQCVKDGDAFIFYVLQHSSAGIKIEITILDETVSFASKTDNLSGASDMLDYLITKMMQKLARVRVLNEYLRRRGAIIDFGLGTRDLGKKTAIDTKVNGHSNVITVVVDKEDVQLGGFIVVGKWAEHISELCNQGLLPTDNKTS